MLGQEIQRHHPLRGEPRYELYKATWTGGAEEDTELNNSPRRLPAVLPRCILSSCCISLIKICELQREWKCLSPHFQLTLLGVTSMPLECINTPDNTLDTVT